MGDIFSKIGTAMQSANSGGGGGQGAQPYDPNYGLQPSQSLSDFVRALIAGIPQRAGGNGAASLLGRLGQP